MLISPHRTLLCSGNFLEMMESTKVDAIYKRKIKRIKRLVFYLISLWCVRGTCRNKWMITLQIFYANFNVGFGKFLVHNSVCWIWLKNQQRKFFASVTRFVAILCKKTRLDQFLVTSWLYFMVFTEWTSIF